jgi:hypothetical protein
MGALPQVLEIIFEVQRKKNNEKITRKKKKAFQLPKHVLFFCLWISPIFKPHIFLISYSF